MIYLVLIYRETAPRGRNFVVFPDIQNRSIKAKASGLAMSRQILLEAPLPIHGNWTVNPDCSSLYKSGHGQLGRLFQSYQVVTTAYND